MIYLAYCSAATELMRSAELVELLRLSHQNNERDRITGMLLYHEGSFMQVLEGEPETVHSTYARILRDPRHRNVIKLAEAPLAERNFGSWAMSFKDTRDLSAADLAAYSLFLKEPIDSSQYGGHRALKLLLSFREVVK